MVEHEGGSGTAVIEDTVRRARELMDKASDEDREDMIDLIERIQDALKENDMEAAMELREELDDIVFYLK